MEQGQVISYNMDHGQETSYNMEQGQENIVQYGARSSKILHYE